MNTRSKACAGLIACLVCGWALNGCIISKKTEVEERDRDTKVMHEKTIETERPVVEKEKTVIERK